MMAEPGKLVEAQVIAVAGLHEAVAVAPHERLLGGKAELRRSRPAPEDKRFSNPAWKESDVFDFIKQSYLLTARWMQATVRSVEGLDDKTAQEGRFLHPPVRRRDRAVQFRPDQPARCCARRSRRGGENLVKGLENLLDDLERGKGQLQIRMTDPTPSRSARTSPSPPARSSIQNDLMQLIQYEPTTAKVNRRPLLIMPPWINKYYILDLRPRELLHQMGGGPRPHRVRRLLGQPGRDAWREKTFDDYMLRGAARVARRDRAGHRRAGGQRHRLLPRRHLARLRRSPTWRRRQTTGVASATYFVALVDFTEPGELGVFIDEDAAGTRSRSG